MILGNIKNAKRYFGTNQNFADVFKTLASLDKNTKPGKIEIKKDSVWISIADFNECPSGKRLFEAHKDFLDIHFILSGTEKFACADTDTLKIENEYDSTQDFMLLSGDGNEFTLCEGDFCVVYPEDAHIPVLGIGHDVLKKAIVKIKL